MAHLGSDFYGKGIWGAHLYQNFSKTFARAAQCTGLLGRVVRHRTIHHASSMPYGSGISRSRDYAVDGALCVKRSATNRNRIGDHACGMTRGKAAFDAAQRV